MNGYGRRYVVEEIGEGRPDFTAVDAVALIGVCRYNLFQSCERTEDHNAIVFIQCSDEEIWNAVIGKQLSLRLTKQYGATSSGVDREYNWDTKLMDSHTRLGSVSPKN